MENFDRENIDELLEIRQIRQKFAPYGIATTDSYTYLIMYALQLCNNYVAMILICTLKTSFLLASS